DGTIILFGNWINNSNTNFSEGNSSVIFEGTTNQLISSSDNEVFYNLEINNTQGLTLTSNTSVAGNLALSSGIISNPTDTLTVGINAGQLGSLTHIDGHTTGVFQRWVNGANQPLLFPVGNEINPELASINFNTAATGTFSLSFQTTLPTNNGLSLFDNGISLENNFSEGFWRTASNNGIVSPQFNISLTPTNFSSYLLNSQSRIVERFNNGNWLVQGNHGGLTGGVISRNNLTASGEFAIASGRECVSGITGPAPSTQAVCVGDAILPVSINTIGGQGTINYQWYFGVLNNTTSGNSLGALNGAQTNTYIPPTDFDSNGFFYCIVTQPGSACTPVVSSTSQINFSTPLNPSISITADATEICGSTNTVNFTSNGNELGSNPTYQWYLNGNPVGANNPTFVLSNAVNGDVVYLVVTPSEICKVVSSAQSNNITLNVTAGNTFYQDLDGDGFGNQSVSINTCVQPVGYIPAPVGDLNFDGLPDFDCNDNNEDVNPSLDEICSPEDDNCDGFINEGYAATLYYQDLDGDTFGNPIVTVSTCSIPPLGYVLNNSDCNDTNAAVRPNATEICDGIDNDCDATIDEGCGPINDLRLAALIIYPNVLGSCSQNVGTLIGATVSPESQSACPTGEDVWYYFTATSPAVSILCNSANTNVLIELQHENGTMMEVENIQNIAGLERLNYSGLT
ncbi:MAG: putative metal-binding motif-containing protein, partial [Flavobacteriales bacterium]